MMDAANDALGISQIVGMHDLNEAREKKIHVNRPIHSVNKVHEKKKTKQNTQFAPCQYPNA